MHVSLTGSLIGHSMRWTGEAKAPRSQFDAPMKGGVSTMAERVGFIGLGIMGKPMAGHLATAGYELVVHNRSRQSVDELTGAHDNVKAATSPREVAEQSDIVIT